MVSKVVDTFVTGKEKAVAGALVAFVIAFLAQHFGYHVTDGLQQTLQSLVVSAFTYGAVFLERNTEVKKLEQDLNAALPSPVKALGQLAEQNGQLPPDPQAPPADAA